MKREYEDTDEDGALHPRPKAVKCADGSKRRVDDCLSLAHTLWCVVVPNTFRLDLDFDRASLCALAEVVWPLRHLVAQKLDATRVNPISYNMLPFFGCGITPLDKWDHFLLQSSYTRRPSAPAEPAIMAATGGAHDLCAAMLRDVPREHLSDGLVAALCFRGWADILSSLKPSEYSTFDDDLKVFGACRAGGHESVVLPLVRFLLSHTQSFMVEQVARSAYDLAISFGSSALFLQLYDEFGPNCTFKEGTRKGESVLVDVALKHHCETTNSDSIVLPCAHLLAQNIAHPPKRGVKTLRLTICAAKLVVWTSHNAELMPRIVAEFPPDKLVQGLTRAHHSEFFEVLRCGCLKNVLQIVALHDVHGEVLRELDKIRVVIQNPDMRVVQWAVDHYAIRKDDVCGLDVIQELVECGRYESLRYLVETFDIRRPDVRHNNPKLVRKRLLGMTYRGNKPDDYDWFVTRFI